MRPPPIAPLGLALGLAGCGGGKSTSDTDTATDATSGETTVSTTDPTSSGSTLATDPSSSSASTSIATTSTSTSTSSDPTTGGAAGEPAKYSDACAPDDGAAVEFSVGIALRECTADFPEDAPIFRITLFQGVAVPVGEHQLDGGFGMAYLDTGDGTPVTGTTGTLTILAEVADGLVGTYDVTLSDDTHLAGSFDAVYCPQDVLCG